VHELVAHPVGAAADTASGRLDGAPGEEWTARHVAERRQRPLCELLAEWELVGPRVELSLTGEVRGPHLAADIICHEGDLHEALGLPRPDRHHWQPVLEAMMGLLGRRLRQPGTLVIRDEQDQEWRFGEGDPHTLLSTDGYELLRGTFNRRSQRQIAGWNWTACTRSENPPLRCVWATRGRPTDPDYLRRTSRLTDTVGLGRSSNRTGLNTRGPPNDRRRRIGGSWRSSSP